MVNNSCMNVISPAVLSNLAGFGACTLCEICASGGRRLCKVCASRSSCVRGLVSRQLTSLLMNSDACDPSETEKGHWNRYDLLFSIIVTEFGGSAAFSAAEPADLPFSVHFRFWSKLVLAVSFQFRFRPKPRFRCWYSQKLWGTFIFPPQLLFLEHNILFFGFNC